MNGWRQTVGLAVAAWPRRPRCGESRRPRHRHRRLITAGYSLPAHSYAPKSRTVGHTSSIGASKTVLKYAVVIAGLPLCVWGTSIHDVGLRAVVRFLAGDRLGGEGHGDEEADPADRQGERPESLVVVVGRCPSIQLVGDTLAERVRGQNGLYELQRGPFGAGEVGGVPPGRHGGDALFWFPGLAEVAGLPDCVVGVAGDLRGAQLHQVDGGLRDRSVSGGRERGSRRAVQGGLSAGVWCGGHSESPFWLRGNWSWPAGAMSLGEGAALSGGEFGVLPLGYADGRAADRDPRGVGAEVGGVRGGPRQCGVGVVEGGREPVLWGPEVDHRDHHRPGV